MVFMHYSRIFFWNASCNWVGKHRVFCWVKFESPKTSVFYHMTFIHACFLNICRKKILTSLRSMVLILVELTVFENFLLMIEKHSLEAVWLDGVNWYFSAASQSRSTNVLSFAVTKIYARLISFFPTFKCTWTNLAMSNGRWIKLVDIFLGLRKRYYKQHVSRDNFLQTFSFENGNWWSRIFFTPCLTNGASPIPLFVIIMLPVASP